MPPYFRWGGVIILGFATVFAGLVFWTPWYLRIFAALPMFFLLMWLLSDEQNSRQRKLVDYVDSQ
jgi:hypothetical protein